MAISLPLLFVTALNLPLYGVVLCVSYALYSKQSTEATDCIGVPEFLPSISMVIGSQPQESVWKVLVAICTPIRIGVALLYMRHGNLRFAKVAFVFHLFELASLFLLSYVSSTDDFFIHSVGFYGFAAASATVMALNSLHVNRTPFAVWTERTALLTKRACLFVYVMLLCTAYYLYTRHCSYCEPYSYSHFAICEYCVVLTNFLYHACVLFDFWNWQIACQSDSPATFKRDRLRSLGGYKLLIEQNGSLEHDKNTKV